MAISFPSSPSTGQKFTHGNKVWTWDGNSWKGGVSSGGDAGTLDSLNSTQFLRSDTDTSTTGKLGIGTDNPDRTLHVKSTSSSVVKFETSSSSYAGVELKNISGVANGSAAGYLYGYNSSQFLGGIKFVKKDSNSGQIVLRQQVNGTNTDVVNISDGNVGIGNVLPAHPLHIYEDGGYYASVGRGNSAPGGSDPWLGLFNNTNIANATFGWGIYDSNADGSFQIWNKNNNTTGYDALTILRGGNVGIGTPSPSFKLDVKVGSGSGGAGRIQQQAVTNSVASSNGVFVVEGTEGQIQVIAEDSGSWASNITLSDVPSSGTNKHWTMHHTPVTHPTISNALQFNYLATNTVSYIGGDGTGAATEAKMTITNDGKVGIGTETPGTQLDVNGTLRIQNGLLQLPVYSSDPSTTVAGSVYYNTTDDVVKVYDGTEWVDVGAPPMNASGGTVTTYTVGGASYRSHTFTSSGTFTPTITGTVDIMVVAGGGGAGQGHGTNGLGGGGAGGMIVSTNVLVTPSSYSIVVGAGGPHGTTNGTDPSSNGVNTSAFSLTAIGGGRGDGDGNPSTVSASNGGSGGGASTYRMSTGSTDVNSAGAGTSGQGNAGASSVVISSTGNSGGGGGAGGAGQNGATNGLGGPGGVGLQNSFRTGSNIYYAGGGGGAGWETNTAGAGGSGGGGNGVTRSANTNADGAANTGGGGGASKSGYGDTPGNGGSGIVVIRYLI